MFKRIPSICEVSNKEGIGIIKCRDNNTHSEKKLYKYDIGCKSDSRTLWTNKDSLGNVSGIGFYDIFRPHTLKDNVYT